MNRSALWRMRALRARGQPKLEDNLAEGEEEWLRFEISMRPRSVIAVIGE